MKSSKTVIKSISRLTRFRFNGKEWEGRALRNRPVAYFSEGARLPRWRRNFYYGARYYDPKISVWLSVDAMASKDHNRPLSPYHFVTNNPLILIDPDGNDWIKNKSTNKVEWRANVTSAATTPQGFSYVGARYKGLAVGFYQHLSNSSGQDGVEIFVGYTDNSSPNKNYRWIQTVRTNTPEGTTSNTYNDPASGPDADGKPFYYTDGESAGQKNKRGEDYVFYDGPQRNAIIGYDKNGNKVWNKSQYWMGELTLVELDNNGKANPLLTIGYGFRLINGVVTMVPLEFKNGLSTFQQSTVDNYNNRSNQAIPNLTPKGLHRVVNP